MQNLALTRKTLFTNIWMLGTMLWLGAALLLLSGCANTKDEVVINSIPTPRMPAVPINGAIYSAGTELTLFEDVKAHRTGDILTVILVEQTAGKKSSDTTLNQSTDMSVTPPVLGARTYTDYGVGLGSKNAFAGDSGSSQSNSLSGSVTVTVVEVLPGGNLRVKGEKWIEINQGKESIQLEGVVRANDVKTNNTILSTQVADARISYSGTGSTAHANVLGWMAKLIFSPLRLF